MKLKVKIVIEEEHELEVSSEIHEKILSDPDFLNKHFFADIYVGTVGQEMDKEDIGGNYHFERIEIKLLPCRCGGAGRFNNGSSHAHNYEKGEREKMSSCSTSCRECKLKLKRGEWHFESDGGYEKAKKIAAKKWNDYMK